MNPIVVDMSVIQPIIIPVSLVEDKGITMSLGTDIVTGQSKYDVYDGAYEVTPSSDTQVLETGAKLMTQNVTVNPIPSNYGLITYNGSFITVS